MKDTDSKPFPVQCSSPKPRRKYASGDKENESYGHEYAMNVYEVGVHLRFPGRVAICAV